MRWRRRAAITTVVGLIVGAAISPAIEDYRQRFRPPIAIEKVEALNNPVVAGQSLRVRITREKPRSDCVLKSERVVTDRVTDEEAERWQVVVAGGKAHTPFVDVSYERTANLPPGRYRLFVFLDYHCQDGAYPTIAQPPVDFDVIRGGEG